MEKYIEEIKSIVPYTGTNLSIKLEGKCLVITGGNGSGKTSFITHLHKMLTYYMNDSMHFSEPYHLGKISQLREQNKLQSRGGSVYSHIIKEINKRKEYIEENKKTVIKLENRPRRLLLSKATKSLLMFYSADRKSSIYEPNSVSPIGKLVEDDYSQSFDNNSGAQFENFLVSYITLQSHLIAIKQDYESAKKIKLWIDKIQDDLRELFEDSHLEFKFDIDDQRFYFNQHGKKRFTLQTLSSGYSSIMCIYSDLIMRVKFQDINPEQLRGIVFIDEIDAHLHVTLQKKIFSFLRKSFPEVQFIITTHSPFVIMSVNDVVMYDLSKNDQIGDVSLYSYESVAEGIFDTLPISMILEDKIRELAILVKDKKSNTEDLKRLIKILKPVEHNLDTESQFFFTQAEIEVLKRDVKNV